MSKSFGSRQQGFNYFPLRVAQVTRISFAVWVSNFGKAAHQLLNNAASLP
jgi:hypothetical protein